MSKSISQAELKALFSYDEYTGLFTRLVDGKGTARRGDVLGNGGNQRYPRINIAGTVYRCHRLVFLYMTGEFPNTVDHINHDRYDNRWCNLRDITQGENLKNTKQRSDNTSGVTGVSWSKVMNKWHARIYVDKKKVELGYFVDFSEAVNSRKNAEVLYAYHKNHGKRHE